MSETNETFTGTISETSLEAPPVETIIEKPVLAIETTSEAGACGKIDGRKKPRTEAQLEILKRARIKAQESRKTKKTNLKTDVVIEPVVSKPDEPVVLEEKKTETIAEYTFVFTEEKTNAAGAYGKPEVKYDDDFETKIYNRILERVNKEKEKEKETDVITLVEKKPKYRYEDGYTILNI